MAEKIKIRKGVIPAAGEGMRMYPKNLYAPKGMLNVAGKSIIQRNIEIMTDKLGVEEIYMIIGRDGYKLKNYFGDGSRLGVKINYILQKKKQGIGKAILLAEHYIKEKFVVILGDECYLDSNHEEILDIKTNFDLLCVFKETDELERISKNYSGKFRNGKIISLIEKPKKIKNNLLGCGTYIFSQEIFDFIKKTPASNLRGEVEITDAINNMAKERIAIPFFLEGDYININTIEDLHLANYYYRNKKFKDYKISIIIPAYNEEKTIDKVIRDFKKVSPHEILVINNNSKDKTQEVALKEGAKILSEEKPGYGWALRKGLDNAEGDILVLVEADHSFRSKDFGKILEYMKDANMVVGTRTTREMIEQGANMNWFLRWGNVFLGKFIEVLWWKQQPRFTDVGCTYRAIWKDAWNAMRNRIYGSGPEFSPEMMIEALKSKMRIIEIPVSYHKRFGGESKHSVGFKKIKTGFKMVRMILQKKFL